MLISFNLDNVIFDMTPLYKEAFLKSGRNYARQISWNLDPVHEKEVRFNLNGLKFSDALYTMPVLDKKMPQILNGLMEQDNTKVLFVTNRLVKRPNKSFDQLRKAGINCSLDQVIIKPDTVKDLRPDVHFDDSPDIVKWCIKNSVPVVLISNNSTPYNHHLRGSVEHYPDLRTALIRTGLVQKIK